MNRPLVTAAFATALGIATSAGGATLPSSSVTSPVAPTAPQLTLLGEPQVDSWSPQHYVVQGGEIVLRGSFKPSELRASIGNTPLSIAGFSPATLPATTVRLRVPDTLVSSGEPLVVWYGANGPRRQLAAVLPVLARVQVAAFRVVEGPYVKFDHAGTRMTKVQVDVTGFNATIDGSRRPALFSPGCTTAGTAASSETPGTPYRLNFEIGFYADAAGRRCPLELRPYRDGASAVTVGEVNVPAIATYTIANTADLLQYRSPSGKQLKATASKGIAPCQLASVGTAGSFATGVVVESGDLTFQLRNGLLREDCEFRTTPALVVRDDWQVKAARWEFTRDAICTARETATQHPSGSTVTFYNDGRALFPVQFDATCMPDPADPTRNSRLYRARLATVELVGPAGRRWQDAFE